MPTVIGYSWRVIDREAGTTARWFPGFLTYRIDGGGVREDSLSIHKRSKV